MDIRFSRLLISIFQVCSVHFRQGRPSSDPSHEDFVPHLYLNQEPPPEIISYLESLAETKNVDGAPKVAKPAEQAAARAEAELSGKKPSILKRKRKVPAAAGNSGAARAEAAETEVRIKGAS